MSTTDKTGEASFLTRWSQRKAAAIAPEAPTPTQAATTNPSAGAVAGAEMPGAPHPQPTLPIEPEAKAELPAVDSLTDDADFAPFMARDVDPALRNQAMKKLFSNPHYRFEQMDKLDIYIDDYSQPDPIPLEMLRQLNQAKRLFLFEDEQEGPRDVATGPGRKPVPAPETLADPAIAGASPTTAGQVTAAAENPVKIGGMDGAPKSNNAL
jgi:hypothetical protein